MRRLDWQDLRGNELVLRNSVLGMKAHVRQIDGQWRHALAKCCTHGIDEGFFQHSEGFPEKEDAIEAAEMALIARIESDLRYLRSLDKATTHENVVSIAARLK